MNYIINPAWFYWTYTLAGIKEAAILFGGITFILFLLLSISFYSDNYPFSNGSEDSVRFKRRVSVMVIGMMLLIAGLFVPDKETMYAMMVAKMATYENAEWTAEAIKSSVDYIINAFKSIAN